MGSEGQLVGILSHPPPRVAEPMVVSPSSSAAAPGLAFIILNAGVLHRVGPHRLHVLLARRIAALGVTGLRVDLGGIGDSIASSDATSFRDSAVADTRLAMTSLTAATGAQRFVLFGVCSGADNSLATALADERVAGIVLVDPPTYPTRRGQLRFLRTRVAQRGSAGEAIKWGISVARRRLRDTATRLAAVPDPEEQTSGGRERPEVDVFHTQLLRLIDRGVRILAVYSGIHGAGYNRNDQLFELFPDLRGRMDQMYFPDSNHTFTELSAQAALLDAVAAWTTKRFG